MSDEIYTPAWLFEAMGLEFSIDVAAPEGGVAWVPADRFFTLADDGLSQPWEGRVWMNPPYSKVTPWVHRFVEHASGVCLVPFARSMWLNFLWDRADGLVIPPGIGSFVFAHGMKTRLPVYLAAFGEECVEAISRVGIVRTAA